MKKQKCSYITIRHIKSKIIFSEACIKWNTIKEKAKLDEDVKKNWISVTKERKTWKNKRNDGLTISDSYSFDTW